MTGSDLTPFTVYRWTPTGHFDTPAVVASPRPVLTVGQLIDRLNEISALRPWLLNLPVHVLNMNEEDDDDGGPTAQVWSGLLTDVETDCFNEAQGLVLSLLAWPNRPAPNASLLPGDDDDG